MELTPYLSFSGNCEEALTWYADCLDGKAEFFRYAGSPMADQAPPDWGDKIMHGKVTFGAQTLMGADVVPAHYEAPKGISLSLQMTDPVQAERIFERLARNATVVMPLEKTFWAERFGVLVDRFGIQWQINCGG